MNVKWKEKKKKKKKMKKKKKRKKRPPNTLISVLHTKPPLDFFFFLDWFFPFPVILFFHRLFSFPHFSLIPFTVPLSPNLTTPQLSHSASPPPSHDFSLRRTTTTCGSLSLLGSSFSAQALSVYPSLRISSSSFYCEFSVSEVVG